VRSSRRVRIAAIAALGVAVIGAAWGLSLGTFELRAPAPWTASEIETLRSLWIGSLPAVPPDPSDGVADNVEAAKLGQRLFFDTRLGGTHEVACATCHQPQRRFTDGRQKGHGVGVAKRNTPSIVGVAYSPWLYWDGRKDSLWAQAMSPQEAPNEQGGTRMQAARLIAGDSVYRKAYEALFGPLPDLSNRERFPERAAPIPGTDAGAAWAAMAPEDRELVTVIFVNLAKSIEAYERLLEPGPSRFDAYVEAVLAGDQAKQRALFNDDEIRGLRLFIGDANCTRCHNGPLLTNNEFHNTGVLSFPGEVPDEGRAEGVREVIADPYNCAGHYSDDATHRCPELTFVRVSAPELLGAVRTPSLRNLAGTEPYMHKGQIPTLTAALDHYNRALPAMIGHNEAVPLNLGQRELRQLESFLDTLDAPLATPAEWLAPPSADTLPSVGATSAAKQAIASTAPGH
jgi:cytochrome c peroxidase